MQQTPRGQHADELLDAPRARVRFFGGGHPEENRVFVLAIQRLKERLCGGDPIQCGLKIFRDNRRAGGYAACHRPVCLAVVIAASPEGFIRPALMSARARCVLRFDQMLRGRRGVNFRSQDAAS